MKPYYTDHYVTLYCGDCREVVPALDTNFDLLLTDPPYGLSFMGSKWDYDVPSAELWAICLASLKPGAHLMAFAGTRTQHRMACAIEDAGFEIRDMLAWVYASGFAKSLNVSKAIDKINGQPADVLKFTAWMRSTGLTAKQINEATGNCMASHYLTDKSQPAVPTTASWHKLRPLCGDVPQWVDAMVARIEAEREVVGSDTKARSMGSGSAIPTLGTETVYKTWDITAPATEAALQWNGFGTGLKPSHEPVGVYRKGLTIEIALGILLASLTEEIWMPICQWSNVSASDAEDLLSGIRRKLEKAGAFSVVESAKISALENIESVILAARSSMLRGRMENEKDTTKAASVQGDANLSGKKQDTRERGTQAGRADAMSMVDTFISAITDRTGQNIALLWSDILGAILSQANTYITATALKLTIGLKTLKSLVQANTSRGIGSSKSVSPSHEPITLARRPLIGTVAENVLRYGTGALNIDAARIAHNEPCKMMQPSQANIDNPSEKCRQAGRREAVLELKPSGRWPANFCHDGSPELMDLFPVTGDYSAARFFFCAKASQSERGDGNSHPTVKPIALLQWLIRLGLPPNGVLLDPFAGSGSTGIAARKMGARAVLIEREERYCEIAALRMSQGILPF
jgi:DNA modification methylase